MAMRRPRTAGAGQGEAEVEDDHDVFGDQSMTKTRKAGASVVFLACLRHTGTLVWLATSSKVAIM